MVRAFVIVAIASSAAWACPPAAELAGDPTLVGLVNEILAKHGVATGPGECAPLRARLERRGIAIVVVRMGDPTEERIVSDPATAATVIETWSRSDFEDPLLASHPLAALPLRAEAPAALPREAATQDAVRRVAPRGIQIFAAVETSFADDRTSWAGALIGVCIQVGRVCVSARGRVATVVDGPGMWDEAERHTADVLFGGDVPFALGPTTFTFGIGAGMGSVHTGSRATGMPEGSETFGLRADAHLGWTLRLGHRISLDLSTAIDVAQVTDVEGTARPEVTSEPRLFGRFGAGLRFGAP
jgi:hypothetical protein